jgi:hypothetical protein
MVQPPIVVLSKADILKGKDRRVEFFVEELGGAMVLSPLTCVQWAEVQAMQAEGLSIVGDAKDIARGDSSKMQMSLNTQQLTRAEFNSKAFAVKCSLGDDWTIDEVKSITPAGLIEKIAQKVYEISGVGGGQAAVLESFRQNGGVASGSLVKSARVPARK